LRAGRAVLAGECTGGGRFCRLRFTSMI